MLTENGEDGREEVNGQGVASNKFQHLHNAFPMIL